MGARKKNKKLKRLRAQERKKMFVAYKFSICSQNRSTHWSEIDSIKKRKFKILPKTMGFSPKGALKIIRREARGTPTD